MDSLQFLLPLLTIYPIIINQISQLYPKLRLNLLLFIGPITFLGLTFFSFFKKMPIELFITWNLSQYISLGQKLDVLSGLIATTVLSIGIIVNHFLARYLEDDPKRQMFSKNLSYTLSFVISMLLAPNLGLLLISWIGTSYFLHKLLIHFNHRRGALNVAKQKFWISRFGDLLIITAGAFLIKIFHTLNFDTIFYLVENPSFLKEHYFSINLISFLLVIGAMTKSAQFPFHYWLPNTMETPTPVSALMHAGIINAGGYLIIRLAPLLSHVPISLAVLAIVGGFTAFWGTIIMFSQTSVKKNLAYSTISQMGFMMLQCGLGAFSIAVVHIIGHAFYKAYAFLSSSSATDFGRLNRYFPKKNIQQRQSGLFFPIMLALITITSIVGGLNYLGYNTFERPGVTDLLIILSLGISQIILSSKNILRSITFCAALLGIYLLLSNSMAILLSDIIPTIIPHSDFIMIISISFFISLYLIQNSLEKLSRTKLGKKIYTRSLRGTI